MELESNCVLMQNDHDNDRVVSLEDAQGGACNLMSYLASRLPSEHIFIVTLRQIKSCLTDLDSYVNGLEDTVIAEALPVVFSDKSLINSLFESCQQTDDQEKSNQKRTRSSKPFACNLCCKKFSQASTLKTHQRSHTAARPFECELCSKRFMRNSHLQEHLSTHTGAKPNKCELCEIAFGRVSQLNSHMKSVHRIQSSFQCNSCVKTFITLTQLQRHEAKHAHVALNDLDETCYNFNGSKYECLLCDKSFIDLYYLKAHHTTHTGKQPFICEICGRKFVRRGHLSDHMITHADVQSKPFLCNVCGKHFRRRHDLSRHKAVHVKAIATATLIQQNEDVKTENVEETGEYIEEEDEGKIMFSVYGSADEDDI